MPHHRPAASLRRPLGALLLAAACRGTADAPPTLPAPRPDTTTTPPVTPPVVPPPVPTAPIGLTIVDVFPRQDTIPRVGVDLRAAVTGTVNWNAVVVVDSGTANERTLPVLGAGVGYDSPTVFAVGYAPGPGRHTFTIRLDAGALGRAETSVVRTFVMPDVAYTVAALPDGGAEAGAAAMTEAGTVAGWVRASGGRRRAAVWRQGALQVVPMPDTIDVEARGANAAGDVLLQYDSARAGAAAARVRRPDGSEVRVATANGNGCCKIALELTESRRALATTNPNAFGPTAALLDVATGAIADVSAEGALVVNDAGQYAGATVGGYGMQGRTLRTSGFTAPPVPTVTPLTICDRPRRFSRLVPLALDDAANLLADYCGNVVILPQAGPSEFADRFVGRTNDVRLSRRGGLVVGLDTAGVVRRWRLGTDRTERVAFPTDRWRVDALVAVRGDGTIVANGVERATGRAVALVLTPAGR